jgi:hypothetical protein
VGHRYRVYWVNLRQREVNALNVRVVCTVPIRSVV